MHTESKTEGEVREFTAVINPVSGGDATGRWERISPLLERAGAIARSAVTVSREQAISLSGDLARAGQVVVAVGGDGLIRDVATGVVEAGGVMAIVPAGRGNDLARGLELPTDDAGLVELLIGAEPRAIDVLQVGEMSVPGNVYTGLDSVATQVINDWRRYPAALAYRLAPVAAWLRWKPAQFSVTIDGVTQSVCAHSVLVANSGRYGHGLQMVPSAKLDDGVLEVMVIRDIPKLKMITLMQQAKSGKHIKRAEIEVTQGQQVEISAETAQSFSADGDVIGELPVKVRLRAGALRILAPAKRK